MDRVTPKSVVDRYGPLIALVVLNLVLVLALGGNAGRRPTDLSVDAGRGDQSVAGGGAGQAEQAAQSGSTAAAAAGGGATGGTGATGQASVGGGESVAPGGATAAAASCREDGRQPGFSVAMPPCVPIFTGDNGG